MKKSAEVLVNGVSLTRPAIVKKVLHLFLSYSSFSRTRVRSRRNLLSLKAILGL
jgi:hypothetical protein